ncbi:hypothetical protein H696_05372 [Fonticula alba]|uniref:tRNA-splicing endonuclease subunit Sen54 N-terminal domain-containing protein n=1 Tax=Fonticula alba TaxID=691883 RepID=A0A058Z1V6_FONAL|nr:hypothetical protein H696_05372 [Fonticula alba]KCV68116.1 hypothetical protein H696_05372 [Fonticula alba]|eukprot:XP_009497490.1 hypothetical protein H696_05372 [Fonticula alba]
MDDAPNSSPSASDHDSDVDSGAAFWLTLGRAAARNPPSQSQRKRHAPPLFSSHAGVKVHDPSVIFAAQMSHLAPLEAEGCFMPIGARDKRSLAAWYPALGAAKLLRSRGPLLKSMGLAHFPLPGTWLAPEEAVFLLERGSLLICDQSSYEAALARQSPAPRCMCGGGRPASGLAPDAGLQPVEGAGLAASPCVPLSGDSTPTGSPCPPDGPPGDTDQPAPVSAIRPMSLLQSPGLSSTPELAALELPCRCLVGLLDPLLAECLLQTPETVRFLSPALLRAWLGHLCHATAAMPLRQQVPARLDCDTSYLAVYGILKRLGFVFRRPRHLPAPGPGPSPPLASILDSSPAPGSGSAPPPAPYAQMSLARHTRPNCRTSGVFTARARRALDMLGRRRSDRDAGAKSPASPDGRSQAQYFELFRPSRHHSFRRSNPPPPDALVWVFAAESGPLAGAAASQATLLPSSGCPPSSDLFRSVAEVVDRFGGAGIPADGGLSRPPAARIACVDVAGCLFFSAPLTGDLPDVSIDSPPPSSTPDPPPVAARK